MNYFFEGVFKDKQIWKWIGVSVTVKVAVIIYVIEMMTGQRIWNGYLWKLPLIFGSIGLFYFAIKGTKAKKDEKKNTLSQEMFEINRRKEFRDVIRENPSFQTLCFQCKYFEQDKRSCDIQHDIKNKKAFKTRFKDTNFEYCLYWEKIKIE